MAASLLEDAFAHHVWTTLRLFDSCLALSPEQLETAVSGTYGSILDTMRHTMRHIVGPTPAPVPDGRRPPSGTSARRPAVSSRFHPVLNERSRARSAASGPRGLDREVRVRLGEMKDHLRELVVLDPRRELGDPVGDHLPGCCGCGRGLRLRVRFRHRASPRDVMLREQTPRGWEQRASRRRRPGAAYARGTRRRAERPSRPTMLCVPAGRALGPRYPRHPQLRARPC